MKRKRIAIFAAIATVLAFLAILVANHVNSKKDGLTSVIGERKIDSRNGVRYEDTLVLYSENIERNEYGFELLVEEEGGFVIDADNRLDLLPGTFLLSGHGEAAAFLRTVQIGDMVRINYDDTAVITRHVKDSNLKKIEIKNSKADDAIKLAKDELFDVDTEALADLDKDLKSAILHLKSYLLFTKSPDFDTVSEKVDSAISIINQKYYTIMQSRSVEGRGMWHRPGNSGIDESDLEGVIQFADRLSDLGINTLYVETFWHGMTTYYSDHLGAKHPRMAKYSYGEYGDDYILALISECHKRGIQVHAWVELLRIGGWRMRPSYIKDEWFITDLDGSTKEGFLDPTNPEVANFVLSVTEEMLKKYSFDGISYDYLRYPETGEYGGYIDSGFSENAISLFSKKYEYEGKDLIADLKTDKALRESWHEFKTNAITELLGKVTERVRATDPNAVISASPYGYMEDAKTIYMQDVATWIAYGYVDVLLPMIYTENEDLLLEAATEYKTFSDRILQYTGISPLYNGASLVKNQQLIHALQSAGIAGTSLFASQNYITKNEELNREILSVFDMTTHKGTAISPTDEVNKVFSAWMDGFTDKYDRLYKPHLSSEEREIIQQFIECEFDKMHTPRDVAERLKMLRDLRTNVEKISHRAARERITEQIDYVYKILDVSITRYLLSHGMWDPKTHPKRPDVYTLQFAN